jgi:hypothetical protein
MKKIVLVYYCDSTHRKELVDYTTQEEIERVFKNDEDLEEFVRLTDINGDFNGQYTFTDRIHWIEAFN